MVSLREIESALTSALPIAWEEAEGMRAKKGKSLPSWSKWCYLPLAGWIAIASRGCDVSEVNPDHTQAAALFAAVGAWRVGRGVYRFDETLFGELISTPTEGNIPCDVLFRLPEWCVYLETDPLGFPGVFVHLEEDANNGEKELRFLFHEADGRLIPSVIHLGNYPLSEGVRRSIQTSKLHMDNAGLPYTSERMALDAAAIMAKAGNIVPLILYICSANAEIRQVERVEPTPKPGRKRPPKMPLSPATWEVGTRSRKASSCRSTGRRWLRPTTFPRPCAGRAGSGVREYNPNVIRGRKPSFFVSKVCGILYSKYKAFGGVLLCPNL